jgi:hypothetical protein
LSYNIDTLSKATDISHSQLKKAIYNGDLSARKNGVAWLILAEDAIAYLRSLPQPQMKKARAGNQSVTTATPAHACGD